MPNSYNVSFYRRIVNSQGQCFLTRLDDVRIDSAASAKDALSAAARLFELRHRAKDWRTLADRYRITSARDASWTGAAEEVPAPESDWETPGV